MNMNESWHIPRASLAGSITLSSSNSSNKSHSNPSTVSRNFKIANDSSSGRGRGSSSNRKLQNIDHDHRHRHQQRRADDSKSNMLLNHGTPHHYRIDAGRGGGGRLGGGRQSSSSLLSTSRNNVNSNNNNNTQTPKRGSHSSQGSSDSNNSSQSISSGSLLLTTANLERFAEIHKKQNNNLNSNYNTNLMLASMSSPSSSRPLNAINNKDAVISIEQNLDFVKTKDMDTVSMASSTHFTMVNGEGGPSRKTSGGGICSRGKQVTVLITTMSLLFLIVIIGMVYALELRAREMPKS